MSEEKIEEILKDQSFEIVKLISQFDKVTEILENLSLALLKTVQRVKNIEKNL